MRETLKKLRAPALATMVAIAAMMTTISSADAHNWHHHGCCGGGWGWGGWGYGGAFVGGLALGALATRPYYYRTHYAYAGNCWRERRVFWRNGYRHVRFVTVCR